MRVAFRSLLKSPGFTTVALLTLAFGIGVNTSAFSVLNALLLHDVPYPEQAELIRLYRIAPGSTGRGSAAHAPANFFDYRAQNAVFSRLAALQFTSLNFAEANQPADRLKGMLVTPDFFPLLGIPPLLGRTFTVEEERPGQSAVAVISHSTWRQRFGGEASVIGRTVRINGEAVEIVGVMPAVFDDPLLWGEIAAWRPLALSDRARQDRDNNTVQVIGRLKTGLTREKAQAGLNALSAQLEALHPRDNAQTSVRLHSLASSAQDDVGRGVTSLVMGLAGFVLLIACANLANLQFARNVARGREHAIRAALGASRGRLVRAVLLECLLLSLAGGGLGVLLALWSNEIVGKFFVFGERTGFAIPHDHRVMAFALTVSLLTSVGFGLLPAWLASGAKVGDALKQGGRGTAGNRSQHRVQRALIVGEVALALVLLAGAGFFQRGLQRFTQRDPGWRSDGLLTGYVNLRGPKYANASARAAFARQFHERLGQLPGVERVTLGSSLPTFGFNNSNSFVAENRPEPLPGQGLDAAAADVMPGYFETLGIRLVQGRDFAPTDRADSPAVVIVNESMARSLWPNENPIGKRIGSTSPFMSNPREVIGVVGDVRALANIGALDGRFQMYRPLAQRPQALMVLVLRVHGEPENYGPALRSKLAEIDPDVALFQVGTVWAEAGRGLASLEVAGWTLVAFALLGLALAAVGIYGVIAHSVAQRTNEIGLRMALGAQVRDVHALVVGGGLRLTLLGVGLGLAGAWGMARLLTLLSPNLSAGSIWLTASVTLGLVAVAMIACWIPARRAARINPIEALRAE